MSKMPCNVFAPNAPPGCAPVSMAISYIPKNVVLFTAVSPEQL